MKCVVIDDEPLARKGMQLLIEQVPKLELLGVFSDAVAADAFLKENKIDLLFLDIQMPKLNGMEYIRTLKQKPRIIITTAYPQFAVEAFELEVADYLVKPIRFERFYKAVSRLMDTAREKQENAAPEDDYVFIRTERKYIRTLYSEIDYIEGLKDYVIIHCGNEKHTVATNLKNIASKLPAHLFFRINRSFVINFSRVKEIDNDHVILNNRELPIGESFKKLVADFLLNKKVLRRGE